MKIRVILLVIITSLNVPSNAQIKDGKYVEIFRDQYMEGLYIKEFKKNTVVESYSEMGYRDSTIGTYSLQGGYINFHCKKKPIDINQIKVYNSETVKKTDDLILIVRKSDGKRIMGSAKVLFGYNSSGKSTDSYGRISIKRSDFQSNIRISALGYQDIIFKSDTLGCRDADSIVVRFKDAHLNYREKTDQKFHIRNINANGFELLQGTGGYIQYLKLDYLINHSKLKPKNHYTKEEYDSILKL